MSDEILPGEELRIANTGHVDEIPEQPPSTGREASIRFRPPGEEHY